MIETENASRRVAALQRMLTGNNSKNKTMQYTQDHDTETESMCVGNEIREIQTKRWEEEEEYDVVKMKMDAEVTTMTNFEETTGAPAGVERERPAPGGGAGTLKVTDSRTGKKYEVRVSLSLSLSLSLLLTISIYICVVHTQNASLLKRGRKETLVSENMTRECARKEEYEQRVEKNDTHTHTYTYLRVRCLLSVCLFFFHSI